jgi:hypothetical protein
MKKYLLTLVFVIVGVAGVFAQSAEDQKEAEVKAVAALINAQKTANSKDLITTFFQAGINNLLGNTHSFTLNSSFYGIDSVFRDKSERVYYERERWLRQSSFNIALTSDSSNNITKIGGGFTFTIINKTDIKYTKFANADVKDLVDMQTLILDLKKGILSYIAVKHQADYLNIDSNRAFTKSWTDAVKKHDFTNLHPYIKEALGDPALVSAILRSAPTTNKADLQAAINGTLKGADLFHTLYTNIAAKYAHKPLWTFSPTGVYNRVTKQGEYVLASNFTVGLTSDPAKKPWEIEVKSQFKFASDTTISAVNYNNKPFTASIGVNKILIENEDKESKMEFKFFTSYDHQFGSAPKDPDMGSFFLNSTLRINVFKSLWLPVTIKYDPKSANLFGYFSITANLGN